MKSLVKTAIIIIAIGAIASIAFYFSYLFGVDQAEDNNQQTATESKPTTYEKLLPIKDGDTYGVLMASTDVGVATSTAIFTVAQDVYDLTKIRVGRDLRLVYDIKTDQFQKLIYQIDSETELQVVLDEENNWQAEVIDIPYEVKIRTVEGTIDSSMYEAALDQGIDERAVIAFAEVFQWTIDFAWQVRQGDSFKFIYEERYLDGEYIMPGQVLAGKFINNGKNLYGFAYHNGDQKGYFDEVGNSLQKMFLKAPLAFKYISSGFTTGSRYISAFNISTGHRAIDYAAAYGTPIRSVGDGTIVFAGWNGSYGNMVKVRHNSTYQTNYAHMSRMAVKSGQRVSQGQTIGYVGSTGLSTGPHLHYEMEKHGTKINPLVEELPATEGISEDLKPAYLESIIDLKNQLDD